MADNYPTIEAALDDYSGRGGLFTLFSRTPVLMKDLVFEFLADGATRDLSVDGTTPVKYKYTAPEDTAVLIGRCCILIVDGSQSPTKFGGINPLTNGLVVQAIDIDGTTVLQDFTGGELIKFNSEFVFLAGIDRPITAAAGDDVLEVRWTLTEAGAGSPGMLLPGQSLQVTVQDNLTAITSFRWKVQGRKYPVADVLKSMRMEQWR